VFLVSRSEVAEREQVLRTRAMRERDEMRAVIRHYRYTLLRVRMPDGLLLQGKVPSLTITLQSLQSLQYVWTKSEVCKINMDNTLDYVPIS